MNVMKKENTKKAAWQILLRRGLLIALILAATVLVIIRQEQPTPAPIPSFTPAPTQQPLAEAERTRREQAYDKDVAALTALLESGAADADTQAQAARRLDALVGEHQAEMAIEEALRQAGFAPCLALMSGGALTVMLDEAAMNAQASAAILALCTAHTDLGAENIRIMALER